MNQFYEKVNSDPALREKYDAVLKKHEATKDRDAVAAELAELAKAEGFNISPDEVLNIPLEKGEISEEQLESISGGGSGWALCMFDAGPILFADIDFKRVANGPPIKHGNKYVSFCYASGSALCTWAGCRCWGTKHCKDSHHECDENGNSLSWHGLTS